MYMLMAHKQKVSNIISNTEIRIITTHFTQDSKTEKDISMKDQRSVNVRNTHRCCENFKGVIFSMLRFRFIIQRKL